MGSNSSKTSNSDDIVIEFATKKDTSKMSEKDIVNMVKQGDKKTVELAKKERPKIINSCNMDITKLRDKLFQIQKSEVIDFELTNKLNFNDLSPAKMNTLEEYYVYCSSVIQQFEKYIKEFERDENKFVGDLAPKCNTQLPYVDQILDKALLEVKRRKTIGYKIGKKITNTKDKVVSSVGSKFTGLVGACENDATITIYMIWALIIVLIIFMLYSIFWKSEHITPYFKRYPASQPIPNIGVSIFPLS